MLLLSLIGNRDDGTGRHRGDGLGCDGEGYTADELGSLRVRGLDAAAVAVAKLLDAAKGVRKRVAGRDGVHGRNATDAKEEGGEPIDVNPRARALEEKVRRQGAIERAMEVPGKLNHLLLKNTYADDANRPGTVAVAVDDVDVDDVSDMDGRTWLVADDVRVARAFSHG